MGLGAGHLVTLARPPASDVDYLPFWSEDDFSKKYLITSATYAISINQYETGDVADADEPFKATYTLLDSQTPFRPRRTARKPRIEGPQTAIVVGAPGDEICTDELGRVKVQFDWDRKGERDQKSGCWVRVAQLWAGKQWGAMHIPRVGQEVIVEFLDGDPDRPIITGRVYNKDNMPPYDLPKNKTQSGVKSRSSKGGTGQNFNEIRFEDLKGKEELHIQAELDMSTNVKRNQTLYVGGDQNVTIHGNQSVSVHGTDEKTGKKLPVQSTTSVTGKHTFDASDTIKIQAPTSITLECGGSTIVMVPGKITLTAGGGATVVLDANVLAQSNPGAKVLLDANVLAQSLPGAQVLLDANVLAQSVPGAQVVLDANVTAQSVAGSKLALDANAAMEGTVNASVKGAVEATLAGAAGSVKAGPAGAEVAGPKVDVNGQAMVSIAGATVKIN
jgi:type VI secretion system secreted protein VgrG